MENITLSTITYDQIENMSGLSDINIPIYRLHNPYYVDNPKDPDYQMHFFIDLESIKEFILYELCGVDSIDEIKDKEMKEIVNDLNNDTIEFPYTKNLGETKEGEDGYRYMIDKLDAGIPAKEILSIFAMLNEKGYDNPPEGCFAIDSYDIHIYVADGDPGDSNYRYETFDFEINTFSIKGLYEYRFEEALLDAGFTKEASSELTKDILEKLSKEKSCKIVANTYFIGCQREELYPIFPDILARVGEGILQKIN
jgi:hypothetical protein